MSGSLTMIGNAADELRQIAAQLNSGGFNPSQMGGIDDELESIASELQGLAMGGSASGLSQSQAQNLLNVSTELNGQVMNDGFSSGSSSGLASSLTSEADGLDHLSDQLVNGNTAAQGHENNQGLASELLNMAMRTNNPQDKAALIQAAIDLMGGNGANAGAGAMPAGSTDPSSGSDPSTAGSDPSTGGSDPAGTGGSPMCGSCDPSTSGSDPSSSGTGLTVNGNSVDTGRYVITGSTDKDGSLKIFDKQTNSYVNIWGDPHVATSSGVHAQFQKDGLTIELADGTDVQIRPTATNHRGVSHIDEVAITQGNQAVEMSGFIGGQGMQTSQVMDGSGSQVRNFFESPNQTVLEAGSDSVADLHYTNADGSMGAAVTSTHGKQTNLDGAGGALDPSADPPGQQSNIQLAEQLLQLAANNPNAQVQRQLMQAAADLLQGNGAAPTSGNGGSDPSQQTLDQLSQLVNTIEQIHGHRHLKDELLNDVTQMLQGMNPNVAATASAG